METTFFNSSQAEFKHESLIKRFFTWCKDQEKNRLIWLGIALTVHGCVLTPITFMAVAFSGLNLFLVYVVIAAMAATVIPNLAAQPTKVTLPLFFLSVIIDVLIIIYSLTQGLSAGNVY
jgi:predicted membrane protein